MFVFPLLSILEIKLRSTGYAYLLPPEGKEYSSGLHTEIQNRISYITVSTETLIIMSDYCIFTVNIMHICFPNELQLFRFGSDQIPQPPFFLSVVFKTYI